MRFIHHRETSTLIQRPTRSTSYPLNCEEPYIWESNKGDLLFTDWDPNGVADDSIDHVMEVVGVDSYDRPLISQKSNNRHGITLAKSIALAQAQGKTVIHWYAMRNI